MASGPDHSSSSNKRSRADFDQSTRQAGENSSVQPEVDSSSDESGRPRIGRYEIISKLGKGGFGNVYRAFDPELNCDVAIKVPRADRILGPRESERFRDEARTLARIRNHPSIVTVYDVGQTDDGVVYAVMEFVEGEPLSQHIAEQELTTEESLQILMNIAEALKTAHQATIVHRDLKPSNVILNKSKSAITLVDFGLALHDDLCLTDLGNAVEGTPKYMAPEQIRGENHRIDGQTDIWAFGVTMYRILTGKHPFRARDTRELARVIRYKDPKPLRQLKPTLPKEIERICLKCLSKMMCDRYQSTSDLIEELANAIVEMQAPSEPANTASAAHQLQQDLDRDFESGKNPLDSRRSSPSGQTGPSANSAVSNPSQSQPLQITYKGLRPFDSNDRDFFLDLLPGPMTRENVPESIQFWRSRIIGNELEPLEVGLIYGPSGCGKSSFVRAGLLPLLPAQINPVYLECTAEGTEHRLARQIAHKIDSVNGEESLTDILRQFRRGEHLADEDSLLIVLDQFEQWLHGNSRFDEQELTEALRQCDGEKIYCILLIRDDFWMSTSQFMKTLEIPIREGQNALALPLFDERHARKVLVAYGRSFQQLPQTTDEQGSTLSHQQKRFIREAVKSLAQNGKVICVHLSVFAQIAKDRDWTASELHRLGGLQGVGVRFLDDLFGSQPGASRGNEQDEITKSILSQLLPASRADIKGSSQTGEALWNGLGNDYSRQSFDTEVNRLESEFRLISPVDDGDTNEQTDSHTRAYRLTHDFLVSPIREWLDRKQKETRKGRAIQRLSELGDAWDATKDPCYLPGLAEYSSFLVFAPIQTKTKYKNFLTVAKRKESWRLGAGAVALILISFVIGYLVNDGLNKTAKRHVDNYLVASAENAPAYAEVLNSWGQRSKSQLQAELDSTSTVRRLRASSFLINNFGNDPSYVSTFVDALKQVDTNEFKLISSTIANLEESEIADLTTWARNSEDDERTAKFSMLFLDAGYPETATNVLDRRNSYGRSYFIKTLPAFVWNVENIVAQLESTKDSDFKSGLCLALSEYWKKVIKEHGAENVTIPFSSLQNLFNSTDSNHGTRSAAEFVLRKWGNRPAFENNESRHEDGWKSIQLTQDNWATFARISGGTFDPSDGLTNELISQFRINGRNILDAGETTVTPFYLCTIPVTQSLFQKFADQLPADHELRSGRENSLWSDGHDDFPASGIKWHHAVEFCNWLSDVHGLPRYYRSEPISKEELMALSAPEIGFAEESILRERWVVIDRDGPGIRLPFALEWQFAYRADTTTLTPFSNSQTELFWDLYTSFRQETPLNSKVARVFARMPNQFGLFDMAGNTSQWCNDLFEEFFNKRCGGHNRSGEEDLFSGVFEFTAINDSWKIESIRLAINPGPEGYFPKTRLLTK